MGVTFSFFQNCSLSPKGVSDWIGQSKKVFKKKEIQHLEQIISDINLMIGSSTENIYPRILNKLVMLTESEYGMVGRVTYDDDGIPQVHVLAITNIAWDSTSLKFYKDNFEDTQCLRSPSSVFTDAIVKNKPLILNQYNPDRNILPEGHPLIRRCIAVPFSFNSNHRPSIIVCLCNRLTNYKKIHIKALTEIISIIGYLSVIIE